MNAIALIGGMALVPEEANRLARCEAAIARGIKAFGEVGAALFEIREGRLYRQTHGTFDDYCQERWGMSKTHANRLINASAVMTNVIPIGVIPTAESQVRPLAKMPPDEQKSIWREAVETAPRGKVTARHVESVVKARCASSAPTAAASAINRVDPKALWLWGRLRDFERDGLLSMATEDLLSTMTAPMIEDCLRLAPMVAHWLEEIEYGGR